MPKKNEEPVVETPVEPAVEPSLADSILQVAKETIRERVLACHRVAFEIHAKRLQEGEGKGLAFLDAVNPIARFRFTVQSEGSPLTEPQVEKLIEKAAEAAKDGNLIWAASAIDTVLASDKILRIG